MDLGAMICRPKSPLCERCPIAQGCAARKSGEPDAYPRRTQKADRPRRFGDAYILRRDGEVALVRRPPRGLLGGMLALPTSDWAAVAPAMAPPIPAAWREIGQIEHTFTHFALTLRVWEARTAARSADYLWTPEAEAEAAMPSVFAKALRLCL